MEFKKDKGKNVLMEKIVSLAKRRGFIFPSSEIYGGFSSCYDYGPLGVELKNNIKQAWWQAMVREKEDIVGLDSGILMSPKVWQASGHLTAGFADELVECKNCHKRFRRDEIVNKKQETPHQSKLGAGQARNKKQICPDCGGELTKEKKFNLMMKTFVGPVEDEAAITYLRAETCQGIYMNYQNVLNSMRMKIPFGIAQVGKAFRNEITPGNFTYRTREFEQMEMQWFCLPSARRTTRKNPEKKSKISYGASADSNAEQRRKNWGPKEWFDFWKKERMKWYLDSGVKKENLRLREHKKDELAHYAKRAVDIEYKFPWGWQEIEGIHDRGDWDLSNHQKHSGQDLSYFDEETKEKYIPHIIETSAGADRSALVFLIDAYQEIKGGRTKTTKATKETEVVLKFHPNLVPTKVAVLPLVKNKPKLVKKAKEVYQLLQPHFMCQYDEGDSIGRRYRRQDEIGTMWCITVDFESLKQNDVTIRDRDTMSQIRVETTGLKETIQKLLEGEKFSKFIKLVK